MSPNNHSKEARAEHHAIALQNQTVRWRVQTRFPIQLSMSSNDHSRKICAYYNTIAYRIQMLRSRGAISSSLNHLMQTRFPVQLSISQTLTVWPIPSVKNLSEHRYSLPT